MAKNVTERRKEIVFNSSDLIAASHNHSMRLPICFLIDCSDSPNLVLSDIARELGLLTNHITESLELRSSVELMVMSYSDKPELLREFQPLQNEYRCTLRKQKTDQVSIYNAMRECCRLIRRQKQIYRARGINFYKPTVFLFSSGAHEEDTSMLETLCAENTRPGHLAIYAITRSGNGLFERISTGKHVFSLDTFPIKEMFKKIENSMESVSRSSGAAYQALMDAAEDWT